VILVGVAPACRYLYPSAREAIDDALAQALRVLKSR